MLDWTLAFPPYSIFGNLIARVDIRFPAVSPYNAHVDSLFPAITPYSTFMVSMLDWTLAFPPFPIFGNLIARVNIRFPAVSPYNAPVDS